MRSHWSVGVFNVNTVVTFQICAFFFKNYQEPKWAPGITL